jgi:hypothetical protein
MRDIFACTRVQGPPLPKFMVHNNEPPPPKAQTILQRRRKTWDDLRILGGTMYRQGRQSGPSVHSVHTALLRTYIEGRHSRLALRGTRALLRTYKWQPISRSTSADEYIDPAYHYYWRSSVRDVLITRISLEVLRNLTSSCASSLVLKRKKKKKKKRKGKKSLILQISRGQSSVCECYFYYVLDPTQLGNKAWWT